MRRHATWLRSLVLIHFLSVILLPTTVSATTNAAASGDWISVGVPVRMNVGAQGFFYSAGNDHGTCASTLPSYFRVDMSKPYWKEFYAMVLLASSQQKVLDCIVVSGCGTSEVWIQYCTLPL